MGEEIYLNHLLHRVKDTEEEISDRELSMVDHHHHHNPDKTVGEELWRIHCKRSRGRSEEWEEEESTPTKSAKSKKGTLKNKTTTPIRCIQLRNRIVNASA